MASAVQNSSFWKVERKFKRLLDMIKLMPVLALVSSAFALIFLGDIVKKFFLTIVVAIALFTSHYWTSEKMTLAFALKLGVFLFPLAKICFFINKLKNKGEIGLKDSKLFYLAVNLVLIALILCLMGIIASISFPSLKSLLMVKSFVILVGFTFTLVFIMNLVKDTQEKSKNAILGKKKTGADEDEEPEIALGEQKVELKTVSDFKDYVRNSSFVCGRLPMRSKDDDDTANHR